MKLKIIEPLGISEAKAEELFRSIIGSGLEMEYYNTRPNDMAEVIRRSQDADIVMLANMPYRQVVLEKCSNLKMLSVAFTGIDHIDAAYCRVKDIMICNCAGYSNEAVSELVIGMILALYRKLAECDTAVRNGKTREGLIGLELAGRKFGVIGTGAIGLKTAALAKAFGCEVYGYSRTARNVPYIKNVELAELMEVCDIVSVHVPLNESTRGMINEALISKMKANAVLINTARGPIVDYAALADALQSGRIAGAGIDVFEGEPPIDSNHKLFQVPNVLAAPHIGFATQEALEKRAVIAFENVKQWLNKTPQNVM